MMDEVRDHVLRLRQKINTGAGRIITIAAGILVLAVAALLFLRDTSSADMGAIRDSGRSVLFCCPCGHAGQTRVAWEQRFPLQCPQCGENTAAEAFRCVRCRTLIEVKSDPVFYCPHCKYKYDNRIDGRQQP